MHVLIIPASYPNEHDAANGCFFRDQALALNNFGYSVGVLVPPVLRSLLKIQEFRISAFGYFFAREDNINIMRYFGVLWIPLSKRFYAKISMFYALKMYERYVLKYGKPDFIHAHGVFYAGMIASEIQRKNGVPYFLTEHSTAYLRDLLSRKELRIATTVAGGAQKCLAVSKFFAEKLNQIKNMSVHWTYVPNLLAAEFENAIFTMPDENSKTFCFCNVSILTPKKNIALLLHAFADAFKGDLSVALNIGGGGQQKIELETLAEKLGLQQQVRFLGPLSRDAVRDLMAASHVYVSSSDVETFGVTIIEMLAMGRPVIAMRSGGPETIIFEPDDGMLVPVGDQQALVEAMIKIRKEYGLFSFEAIRCRCVNRFSAKNVVAQISAIYSQIEGI